MGIDESCEQISGINKSLCSLAQSYFSSPQKPISRKLSTENMEAQNQEDDTREDEKKASLVASYFGQTPNKRTNSFKAATKPSVELKERASFVPDNNDVSNDDDEDEDANMELFI